MNRSTNISIWINAARGLAFFAGCFALAGTLTAIASRFDPNIWWVDLRWLPSPLRLLATGLFGTVMTAYAMSLFARPMRRRLTLAITGMFLVFTLINMATFWLLLARGRFAAGMAAPFSMFAHLAILGMFVAIWMSNQTNATTFRPAPFLVTLVAVGISFPLLQVYCFGKTDYQGRAVTAVVFGARVYQNGKMSMALQDRVTRACALYQHGLVSRLIFSGGPGDGPVFEAEAMRDHAIGLGVPADAIWIDLKGLDTEATVANSLERLKEQHEFGRILAVSEFYHLPRIKLTFQAHGLDVLTVPTRLSHPARNFAFRSILREVPAFWTYLARSVSNNVIR